MEKAVHNVVEARAHNLEAFAMLDNACTVFTQVRKCLTRFREWLSMGMRGLLNILD